MRQNTIFAGLLILFGIAAFSYQGITYKTRGTAVDLGSLQVTTEKTKKIPIPPLVGAVALIGGITLLFRNTSPA
ncbi:MAG: DUF3185 domain-containing protein [Omnitrophica bacterium GWA2_52_8]|nr:MAG: DUF3185 domain-containing protein [Omnitrophica bacterium GWA2_52_8]